MSHICEQCEVWYQSRLEEVEERRRIDGVENDQMQVEYEKDRMWMVEELVALDLKEKLKWLDTENKETEEIHQEWDRLGPYTESDCEMFQHTISVEEKEEKDVP